MLLSNMAAAVVMEPNVGASIRKSLLRIVGTIVGGAFGLFLLYLASFLAHGTDVVANPGTEVGLSTAIVVLQSAVGGGMMLLKLRFSTVEYMFTVLLLTISVVWTPGVR